MARITLTIDPHYREAWGFWEAAREYIQNALDADEFDGRKMSIEHFPRTNKLVISNENITLDTKLLLLLGATTKRGTEQRGVFGEGFALASLAAVRAGHNVTVYNGGEVWRPSIEKAEEGPFHDCDLLVFTTRKLREPRNDFSVEIENVSKEVWNATQKLFLPLSPPKAADVINTYAGKVLLAPEYRGKVFVKGIYVTSVKDVECGYDLQDCKLDSDRHMIEEWDLRWKIANVWAEAHKQAPDKFAGRIYQMAKDDVAEVKSLGYHADKKLLQALADEFHAEHGSNATPVTNMTESKELEALGAKTVVVNKTLQDLLAKVGLGVTDVKTKLQSTVLQQYAWGDLDADEQIACQVWVEKVTQSYTVVAFNDPSADCKLLDDGRIGVARRVLHCSPRRITQVVAVQEAARLKENVEEILLNAFFGKIQR